MPEARRFPLDFDALDKGDRVRAETIEEIFGIPSTSSLYSGKQVELAWRIERELQDRGRDVTVACVKDELHILEDSRASEHNRELFEKGLKRLRRAHRKMMEVDAGQLSPDERRAHDRTLIVQGAVLAGIASARREVVRLTYQRNIPGLPVN